MQTLAEAWILGEDWELGSELLPSPIESATLYKKVESPMMTGQVGCVTLIDCATASAQCMSTYCTTTLGACIGTKSVCGC